MDGQDGDAGENQHFESVKIAILSPTTMRKKQRVRLQRQRMRSRPKGVAGAGEKEKEGSQGLASDVRACPSGTVSGSNQSIV
jgi:hypothetical protein